MRYEQAHRGTLNGLMALNIIDRYSSSSGKLESPELTARERGLSYCIQYLPEYAAFPEHQSLARYLAIGFNLNPQTDECFSKLMQSSERQTAACAKFWRARWRLSRANAKAALRRQLDAMQANTSEATPEELENERQLKAELARHMDDEPIAKLAAEAMSDLRDLEKSGTDLHLLVTKPVEPDSDIYRVDRETEMPSLAEMARGALFKEEHLRLGCQAAEMELTLLEGKTWSLQKCLGKVVVMQFSFHGCGPCESMYPYFHKLIEKHGERVSIVSIMTDDKVEDAQECVKTHNMIWNVHWEGKRGPLNTLWAVESYPTIYVIGPDGKIAGRNLRYEELLNQVAELLEHKEDK